MCVERRELLEAVLLRLQLPVRFAADGVTLEAAQHPFVGHAYSRQQGEGPNQVGGWLRELRLPCRS